MTPQPFTPARRPGPHQITAVVAGSVSLLLIGTGLAVHAGTRSDLALVVAVSVAAVAVLTLAQILWARRALGRAALHGRSGRPRLTGRVLSPAPTAGVGSRWTGGAHMTGRLGQLDVTRPLAVLELTSTGASLRVRGGQWLGAEPVRIPLDVPGSIFPVRGRLVGRGVAVRPPGASPAYFWTRSTVEILTSFGGAGYDVSWAEQRPRRW